MEQSKREEGRKEEQKRWIRGEASMTQGGIWKPVLWFAIPIMASNMFQQFYTIVDSVVVGRFESSEALAAVSAVMPVINLLINLFMGITTGAGVVVAHHIGAQNREGAESTVHTGVLMGLVCGVIMTVIGMAAAPMVPRFMNFSQETAALGTQYLLAYFAGILPMLMYNMGSAMLRAAGDSKRPFYFLLAGGVLNCVLDVLFVAVWRGGVIGAGLASSLSQLVAAVLVLSCMTLDSGDCHLNWKKLRFEAHAARQIMRIGLPAGLSSAMFAISNTLMQTKLNLFGTAAMAGTGAYQRLDGFIYTIENAFGLTATTFTGQNLGAGNIERVKQGARVAIIYSFLFLIPLTVLYLIFSEPILGIFADDPEVIAYGVQLMRYMAPLGWVYIFTEVYGCVARGAGSTVVPMLIMILTVCVFRMAVIYTVLPFWNDIRVIFFCYPASWTLSALCFIAYYRSGKWLRRINEAGRIG